MKKILGICTLAGVFILFSCNRKSNQNSDNHQKPNVILIMADDLGWGDVGYNGNKIAKTPNLDQMAQTGVRFDRFYSSSPVCSPTRGSCLTGRHPYRYGIYNANVGHIKKEEFLLSEVLKENGYATGHFGKWHIGTLTKTEKDSNRGGKDTLNYAPPWENGFDVCFSTEAKVPTWNPMIAPEKEAGGVGNKIKGEAFGSYYWTGPNQKATENLEGDDSRVIMDRAIPFIEEAVNKSNPFFSVIWFHTPHTPVVAGEKYLDMYENQPEEFKHFYGCITAMDEQIGRLNAKLRELGVDKNTIVFFTSDNGPENNKNKPRSIGSAGNFRARKRSLYEGGIRVPGIMTWADKIKSNKVIKTPVSTIDYFPTILSVLGIETNTKPQPIDGINIFPIIKGDINGRPFPIGFQSGKQQALNDNKYKLYTSNKGKTFELYDIINDPSEKDNIAEQYPEIVEKMKIQLNNWIASCKNSDLGNDYK